MAAFDGNNRLSRGSGVAQTRTPATLASSSGPFAIAPKRVSDAVEGRTLGVEPDEGVDVYPTPNRDKAIACECLWVTHT
jgi:hypothetical protein